MRLQSVQNLAGAAVVALSLTTTISAEPWAGQGLNWKHTSGWSIVIPSAANATVATTADDDISISNETLDYFANFRCFASKKEADAYEAALHQKFLEDKVVFRATTSQVTDEWTCTATQGTLSSKELEGDVSLGQLSRGGRFLFFMITSSAKDGKVDRILNDIIEGVHLK